MWFVNDVGRRVEVDVESNPQMRIQMRARGWSPVDPKTGHLLPKPAYLAPIRPDQSRDGGLARILATETGEIAPQDGFDFAPVDQAMAQIGLTDEQPRTAPQPAVFQGPTPLPPEEMTPDEIANRRRQLQAQLAELERVEKDRAPAEAEESPPDAPAKAADGAPDPPAAPAPGREPDAEATDRAIHLVPVPADLPGHLLAEFRQRFPAPDALPEGWSPQDCQALNRDGKQCGRAVRPEAEPLLCKQHSDIYATYVEMAAEGDPQDGDPAE